MKLAIGALVLAALPLPIIAAQAAPPNRPLEEVTVSATPLGGLELSADRIPVNVQSASSKEIERVATAGLSQYLDRRLGSVFVNEAQSNPLQPDVQFRGFVASPLLGQPQGMAVYQNGVRLNDPFGDVVNWALVPEPAIASIDLIPGSNPVFGLNTLGGALSIRTKNGFTHPGTSGELLAGAHGRKVAEVQSGGSLQHELSYYAGARYLQEDGWRQHSPTDALQLFGDLGWRDAANEAHLNVTHVATDLIGNGPVPVQLLDIDRRAIYTHPDRTENSHSLVTLGGTHRFAPGHELQAVMHLRRSDIDTLNGDESLFEQCGHAPEYVCGEDGESLARTIDGRAVAFSPAVDGATLNRSATRQKTGGFSAQYGITTLIAGRENRLVVGTALDRSNVRFDFGSELARFDASRGATGSGIHVADGAVALETRTDNSSLFLTDTLALTSRFDLTIAGRYNDSRIELADQIGTALTGKHAFKRLNAAAGLTYRIDAVLRVYASYSESNRAPSPVELTCADADDPCALPNAFLSDPPLQQVIAKTLEFGADGSWRRMRWHAGVFRTTNAEDILFISAGALTNTGYFDNVGQTRRQGIEINLNGTLIDERLDWFAHYTLLDAEFREAFRVSSPHNPAAVDGEIAVPSGSRIPGVPKHQFKIGANFNLTRSSSVDVDLLHQSAQFLRGDEGNGTAPLSGFTVVNIAAHWQLTPRLLVFAAMDNVLDRQYETFGLFGNPAELLGEEFNDPRFVSPAAPRAAWLGFRCTL